ncbi:MAG TPA: Tn3 family transposase [Bacteroidetes bacterium]|nr:Tn3 family transposase [Bacteroidota bacterium]
MPVRLLTAVERDRLSRFPADVSLEDLAAYATLSGADLDVVRVQRGDTNQLGFAVQLVALRFLGFVPDDVGATPEPVVRHLAKQVGADVSAITEYGGRSETGRGHQTLAMDHLGIRRATASEIEGLEDWLVARALEHDRPSVLVSAACNKLKRDRLLRPGLTVIERAVATARLRAHEETHQRLRSVLTHVVEAMLNELLVPDAEGAMTTLGWLRKRASAETPGALLDTLAKVEWLREQGVDQWDLSAVGPNRLKLLAGLGRRYTNQALQRAVPERRYPVLAALLQRTLREATDEAVDLFDALLAGVFARSRRALRAHDESVARSTEDKARLFHELGQLVLNPAVSNADLRAEIFRWLPPLEFAAAVEEAGRIVHPEGQAFFAYLDDRYGYVRQFAPAFLDTMALRSNRPGDPVVEATDVLRRLNREGRRKLPADVPTAFVEKRWRPFVFQDGKTDGLVNRHGWELAALAVLRDRLRSGDVYTEPSARYADPESYLVPEEEWPDVRDDACAQLGLTASGRERVAERVRELRSLLGRVDGALRTGDRDVRIEDGHIVVPPFDAETLQTSAAALAAAVTDRLPLVDLPDLLIEVDAWTGFSRHLTHGGVTPHPPEGDALRHLYAAVLAQACNVPFTDMAQSADLAYDRLHYASTWHLREETLTSATDTLVNDQYRQPLAALWGSGTLSSSDGQRFPVRGKVRGATAIPRYFGYGRGITFYTWTSDQYSQYGTKVISTTVRDATYVLDEILDNETDLDVLEHTTDHAGYTDLVFALFDLLGMRFSPRLRDLGDTRVYRATGGLVGDFERYPNLDGVLRGRVDLDRIAAGWDDLLRVAWSLKSGHVTASLLVSKLQARPRQGRLTRLLQEYGRLAKTLHVLRCLESEAHRRRIGAQLNKGERLHQLRAWLTFGGDGKLRRKTEEGQSEQARCLNLVTNAVVVWNTRYIAAVADALRDEGQQVRDEDLTHLSPTRFEHVNRYGRYRFDVDGAPQTGLRPLREP